MMFGFIKKIFKTKSNEEVKKVDKKVQESSEKYTFDFVTKEIESVVNAYFKSLDYVKYNIAPLDVNHFCKELRMNDEEIAKVHKLIKDRFIEIKLEQIQGNFND